MERPTTDGRMAPNTLGSGMADSPTGEAFLYGPQVGMIASLSLTWRRAGLQATVMGHEACLLWGILKHWKRKGLPCKESSLCLFC